MDWPHDGLFGTFDRAAAQRGFQVYREVCAACHGLTYRRLPQPRGARLQRGPGQGDRGRVHGDRRARTTRARCSSGRPCPPTRSRRPIPTTQAARVANGGALPPDLSLITKARAGGTNYVYSLLIGYEEPPADVGAARRLYYNAYFPGHWIAMPPPLTEDQVTYADGTAATVEQMAQDVATFLTWAAEPKLEERKQTGLKVMLFLIVLTGLCYATKRKIWADAH